MACLSYLMRNTFLLKHRLAPFHLLTQRKAEDLPYHTTYDHAVLYASFIAEGIKNVVGDKPVIER